MRVLGLGYNDFHFVAPFKHPRTQSVYTFHYVLSGKGTLHFEGKTYEIGAGEIFALPPAKPICYYPDPDEPWEYVFVEFNGTNAEKYLQEVGFSDEQPVKRCGNPERLLSPTKECLENFKNDVPVSHFEAFSVLMQFFHLALDRTHTVQNSEDVVSRAKEVVKTRFSNPDLTISQIAAALHFSHSRLCHVFRKHTGQTMVAYLNKYRMDYAEELLCKTNFPASKIAYMAGFREYTYFLMLFKRKHGETTSQFRKRFRN